MHIPALHGSATHLCPTPQHVHTHAHTWMDSALHWGLPPPPEPPASFGVSRSCSLWSASSRMTSVEHKKPQTQADSPGDGTGGQLHGPSHDETLAPPLPPQPEKGGRPPRCGGSIGQERRLGPSRWLPAQPALLAWSPPHPSVQAVPPPCTLPAAGPPVSTGRAYHR